MQHDRQDDIVQGAPKFRWPWSRARDLDIGSGPKPPTDASVVKAPTVGRTPTADRPRPSRPQRVHAKPVGLAPFRVLAVQAVVLVALVYHLAGPAAVFLAGSASGARELLGVVQAAMPSWLGVDISGQLIHGASAWMWQPLLAVSGAALLRVTALNAARRDVLSAILIGIAAAMVDGATWLFVGLKLWGAAFTAQEGEALVSLLKFEGAALLVLFFFVAPLGKKRLGQTDADWAGDN